MKEAENTRNVVIGVDVQNDFVSGSLAVPGGEEIVPPLNEIARLTRESGGDIAFTRDWHPEATPHFDAWPVHCVQNTDGASFFETLEIADTDTIISKGMGQTDGYSGMDRVGTISTGKTLEQIVEPTTIQERVRVFIGGLATDYCVRATALDLAQAFGRNERVSLYLIRDAVRAVNMQPNDEIDAFTSMQQANVEALTTAEIKQAFFEQEGIQL